MEIIAADKLKLLVNTGVSKYLTLYEECSKGRDKNSTLYLKWLEYERSLIYKSLQSNELGNGFNVGDVHVNEDTRQTAVILISVQQSSTDDGKRNRINN